MSRFADRLLGWLSPPDALQGDAEAPAAAEARIRREVRAIEIQARTALRERMAGDFRSAFRGRGLEFASIRAYTPGDEVRMIDWNVTARRGAPYVKEFVEERERTLLIVLDVSRSAGFGTTGRSVRRFAIEVAGLLGFSAAASRDRVGAIAFSDRTEYLLRPARGGAHVLRCCTTSCTCSPRARAAISPRRSSTPRARCAAAASWPSSPTSTARPGATATGSPPCAASPSRTTCWRCTSTTPPRRACPAAAC